MSCKLSAPPRRCHVILAAAITVVLGAPLSSSAADVALANDARKTTDDHTVTTIMLDPATSARSATRYALELGQQSMLPWPGHTRQQAILLMRPVFGPGGALFYSAGSDPTEFAPDLNQFQRVDAIAVAETWATTAQASNITIEDGTALYDLLDKGLYPAKN